MSLSDYLHLMKPRIIPLLLFVGVGSAVVAGHSVPPLRVTLGILAGGGLTSAGSLAVNSYLERGIDARMKRTKLLSYLLLNLVATFFIVLGAAIYISVYTILLKPRTTWNIVLGGFAGSCAALAGWYSVTFSDPLAAALLAVLIFVWTPSHFWSLAVITEEDYSAVGIPMLPSVVGAGRASRFIVANTLILIPVSLLLTPLFPGTGLFIYLPAASVMNALLLATNIKLLLSPTKSNAWLAFKFSSPYLAMIFTFAMVAALV
ncbi:MAG: protoheme IX farnesyltransferase [Thaumarchaeota archaeon]|nr:MAG: protoheme IX farnesyltransferase [Nitrososphaerota archaeon]